MFRFWSSDARESKPTTPPPQESDLHLNYEPQTSPQEYSTPFSQPHKRPRCDSVDDDAIILASLHKRPRLDDRIQGQINDALDVIDSMDEAKDRIEMGFQLQIQLKHEEKRMIDIRLAECQAALEQLRRVHLKPYPTNCPTPAQMLDISAGKGHALKHADAPVPRYAPPFGVVDGPYARHYEKWLIPHPDFDGVEYEAHLPSESSRSRGSFAEGRSTRNSFGEPSTSRGRPGRGVPAPRFQALAGGPPQKKATAGPCVLKRSDGVTVKLVCLDCKRENFSSTQGFINHCRIAHKRDFKSHDEAAMKSGEPYEPPAEGTASGIDDRGSVHPAPVVTSVSTPAAQPIRSAGFVNPLARDDMTHAEACTALRARINAALKLYNQNKPVSAISAATKAKTQKKQTPPRLQMAASDTPYLSRLTQSRNFSGNLHDLVAEAKTKISFEDITPGTESEDEEFSASTPGAIPARVQVVKRVPARTTKSPAPGTGRPTSSKARAHEMNLAMPPRTDIHRHISSDEDIEMEEPTLSPTTLVSNNAPSLVSDDGEYDDSDDEGSTVSGHSLGVDEASVSDVADITLDDEHDHRSLRRASNGVTAVRLQREDPKHVSLVSHIAGNRTERRRRKV